MRACAPVARWWKLSALGIIDGIKQLEAGINKIDVIADVLSLLPQDKRLDCANLFSEEITDGYDLACVVEHLPQQYRYDFIEKHIHKIKTGSQAVRVIDCVNSIDSKTVLGIELGDRAQNGYELAALANFLDDPETRRDYLQYHADKIKDGLQFAHIIKKRLLSSNEEFECFAKEHISKLGDSKHVLGHVLAQLPDAKLRSSFKKLHRSFNASGGVKIGGGVIEASAALEVTDKDYKGLDLSNEGEDSDESLNMHGYKF